MPLWIHLSEKKMELWSIFFKKKKKWGGGGGEEKLLLAFDSLPIHPEPCPDWGGADGDNSLGNGEFSKTPQCEGGCLHLFF